MLIIAVRDPRDMLLDWLAFGAASPFALPSPGARGRVAGQLAQPGGRVVEYQWFPNRVVRTDAIGNDPQAAAALVGEALEADVPAPASVGPDHFPAGPLAPLRQGLAGPFALA